MVLKIYIVFSFHELLQEQDSLPFDVLHDPNNINIISFNSKENISTIKTSNSSRHLNGISTTSQRASIKQTVEKERSPPDNERVSL